MFKKILVQYVFTMWDDSCLFLFQKLSVYFLCLSSLTLLVSKDSDEFPSVKNNAVVRPHVHTH